MAVITLTNDQRIAIENFQRFRNLVSQAVLNQAKYWMDHSGNNLPSVDAIRWARSRYIGVGLVLNPTVLQLDLWVKHFLMLLKNIAVVDNVANVPPAADADQTTFQNKVLDYMIANGKFDELADLAFNIEIQKVTF